MTQDSVTNVGESTPAPGGEEVGPAALVKQELKVTFLPVGFGRVKIFVPSVYDGDPLTLELKGLTWGLIRDFRAIENGGEDIDVIMAFWDKYMEGGADSVPLECTLTVFDALTGYLQTVMPKKN